MVRPVGYYCWTWLCRRRRPRSLGDPGLATIPFLAGTAAAVGAILSVIAFFAPSGLGVREASMHSAC